MSAAQTVVIVGAGLAGAGAAEALRYQGFDGHVVLLGEERERPYERPPLSKNYLLGESERDKIYIHPPGWYDDHGVDLRLESRVTAIDLQAHDVSIERDGSLRYDKLLLATGSSPRRLDVPGADLDGALYLRDRRDSAAMREAFALARRVVTIGGGWIGLETAAAARNAGCEVTVLERGELPLLKVLGREVAEIYAALHREHGVDLRLDTQVSELVGHEGRVRGVRLADRTVIDTDAVVVGIGIIPNTSLADAAGLQVDNGVVVDQHLATSDPDVFAAGDVANSYYPRYDTHLRLEHWSAALNQGPVAASNILGEAVPYDRLPYFYSDQYDMAMEYTGYAPPHAVDQVVLRGDTTEREFVAFWMGSGRVLAAMNVNVWDVTRDIKELVGSQAVVDPVRLGDPEVPLGDLR